MNCCRFFPPRSSLARVTIPLLQQLNAVDVIFVVSEGTTLGIDLHVIDFRTACRSDR